MESIRFLYVFPHSGISNIPNFFLYTNGSPKLILYTVRNPFVWPVSAYFFKMKVRMKKKKKYSGPLTFKDALKWQNEIKVPALFKLYFPNMALKHNIGLYAINVVYNLFPNPREIMGLPRDQFTDFFQNGGYKDWFKRVRFIHTEDLRQELYLFLLSIGHSKEQIEFIRPSKRVNVTRLSKMN